LVVTPAEKTGDFVGFLVNIVTGMDVTLAKILGGPERESIRGTTLRTAKGRVGVGMEGNWIGLRVKLCLD